jgi:hypothetical protein
MSNRRTNAQILEDKREELKRALSINAAIVQTLAPEQQESFKKNFLEFASQDYLLNTIEPKEIIRFAVNVTKLGLDIAPSSNEVYIIPFDTKVNGNGIVNDYPSDDIVLLKDKILQVVYDEDSISWWLDTLEGEWRDFCQLISVFCKDFTIEVISNVYKFKKIQ